MRKQNNAEHIVNENVSADVWSSWKSSWARKRHISCLTTCASINALSRRIRKYTPSYLFHQHHYSTSLHLHRESKVYVYVCPVLPTLELSKLITNDKTLKKQSNLPRTVFKKHMSCKPPSIAVAFSKSLMRTFQANLSDLGEVIEIVTQGAFA